MTEEKLKLSKELIAKYERLAKRQREILKEHPDHDPAKAFSEDTKKLIHGYIAEDELICEALTKYVAFNTKTPAPESDNMHKAIIESGKSHDDWITSLGKRDYPPTWLKPPEDLVELAKVVQEASHVSVEEGSDTAYARDHLTHHAALRFSEALLESTQGDAKWGADCSCYAHNDEDTHMQYASVCKLSTLWIGDGRVRHLIRGLADRLKTVADWENRLDESLFDDLLDTSKPMNEGFNAGVNAARALVWGALYPTIYNPDEDIAIVGQALRRLASHGFAKLRERDRAAIAITFSHPEKLLEAYEGKKLNTEISEEVHSVPKVQSSSS